MAKKILGLCIISIGLLGAVYGVIASKGELTLTKTQENSPQTVPSTIDDQKLNQLDINKTSQKGHDIAKTKIKEFIGNHNLSIQYMTDSSNPYRRDAAKIDVYWDDKGMETYLDSKTNEVIQYVIRPTTSLDDPNLPKAELIMSPAHNDKELLDIAEKFLLEKVTNFKEIQKKFTAKISIKEDGGDKVYFFRWNKKDYVNSEKVVPFVQVGVTLGGQIINFANTTSLYPDSLK